MNTFGFKIALIFHGMSVFTVCRTNNPFAPFFHGFVLDVFLRLPPPPFFLLQDFSVDEHSPAVSSPKN